MAYRFNNGHGAVTCDKCNIIIDEDLSAEEYKAGWPKDEDLCMRCAENKMLIKAEYAEKMKYPVKGYVHRLLSDLAAFNKLDDRIVWIISDVFGVDAVAICRADGIIYSVKQMEVLKEEKVWDGYCWECQEEVNVIDADTANERYVCPQCGWQYPEDSLTNSTEDEENK